MTKEGIFHCLLMSPIPSGLHDRHENENNCVSIQHYETNTAEVSCFVDFINVLKFVIHNLKIVLFISIGVNLYILLKHDNIRSAIKQFLMVLQIFNS